MLPISRRTASYGVVVRAQDGTVLYARNAALPLSPASSQKLIVAATGLGVLGPSYRFPTLLAASQPPAGGAVDRLYLIGSGDPSLTYGDLRGAVKVLLAQGLRRVGQLVVDASAVAGEEINPLWNAGDSNEDFEAATSGISLDQDTVEFHVRGTVPGSPATVWLEPPSRSIRWSGSIATGRRDDAVVAPSGTPNAFRLSGTVPAGADETFYLPVHGIPQYVGAVFDRMLADGGVSVATPATTGRAPLDAVGLWNHRSMPLRTLVGRMLFQSNNHFAEQILRAIAGARGAAANDADGLKAERSFLRENGVPIAGLHAVDGSGLAHANRVSAQTLAGILFRWKTGPRSLFPLLPRGGRDGTLKYYRFSTAAGRVRAKSGHLDEVGALAGYVTTHRHGRVVFAILIDASRYDTDAPIVAAVDAIAAF